MMEAHKKAKRPSRVELDSERVVRVMQLLDAERKDSKKAWDRAKADLQRLGVEIEIREVAVVAG